jgi:hypothetical protein
LSELPAYPSTDDSSQRQEHASQCQDVSTDAICSDERRQELGGGCHVMHDVAQPTQADEHAPQYKERQRI